MAEPHRIHAQAALEAWTSLPLYKQWYYFLRVLLIVNKSIVPAVVALVLIAAGIATMVLGQNVLYGLCMMALGAALVLVLWLSRPPR
jgi:hypothetical protein